VKRQRRRWWLGCDAVTGETKYYNALAVASGHHWAARIPEYPAISTGAIHSHQYRRTGRRLHRKSVLVVGMGNSAMDIASELSQRPMAEKLFVSTRRGVWIFPKYYRGQPLDKNPAPAWLPKGIKQWLGARMVKGLVGKMSDYGLPEPEIGPFESHGTVSGEFLVRAGSGDINMKPAVERLTATVVFTDGSRGG
jgi:cation diffusion facilitator CzcD-associated flavoprotein CzcO